MMRRHTLAVCILLYAVSALSQAQPKQEEQHPRKKQEETANSSTIRQPPAPIPTIAPHGANNANDGQGHSRQEISRMERFIGWLLDAKSTDVIMVILTLAYVIVTTRLLIAVRQQAEIAISGERAWLFQSSAPQYWPQGQPAGCQVDVANFGKSPAWIISVAGSFQWIDDLTQLAGKPIYEHINWPNIQPILPDDTRTFIVEKQIAGGPHGETSKLAVFISIKYRDRFNLGFGKPRTLKYCFISTDKFTLRWCKGGPRGYDEYS